MIFYVWENGDKVMVRSVVMRRSGFIPLYFTERGVKYRGEVFLPLHLRSDIAKIARNINYDEQKSYPAGY